MTQDTLSNVAAVLEARKSADADSSYVAKLYHKGTDAILKKIGEEATEVVMAAKDGEPDKIVYEVADLWFHTMVLLAQQNLHRMRYWMNSSVVSALPDWWKKPAEHKINS